MTVLVTGATGMFGARVTALLAESGVDVLAMTRSRERAEEMTCGSVTGVVADLDDPSSLSAVMEQADRLFLVSPMHAELGRREVAAIESAQVHGIDQVVKLYGSVRHEGDQLDVQHQLSIEALRNSGLQWSLVSPQTVMETNLLGQIEGIRYERSMFGSAGDGRIGMVALDDCAQVAAHVLRADPSAWSERNLEITGPEALTYTEIAGELSKAFECPISYIDMSEDAFAAMLIEYGVPAEELELQVLCHFRQMRAGKASLVTDTFELVIGRPATSIFEWARAHRDAFGLSDD
ncbi:MAG: SDR family NAD(P)-dependent oxidoreductase [Phycisphaerales bacterium]|nr:SDR family NAD(P)-dependent oxidoreductase [Phycisphaerales bacterium]